MIGLIVSMVGGVLAGIIGLLMGASGDTAVWIGVAGAVLVFALLVVATFQGVTRHQATLKSRFPAPKGEG